MIPSSSGAPSYSSNRVDTRRIVARWMRSRPDRVFDSDRADLADEVLRLTGGAGADLVLESVGATLAASLAAATRVTGRVVVYGLSGGEATISNLGARTTVGKLALRPDR